MPPFSSFPGAIGARVAVASNSLSSSTWTTLNLSSTISWQSGVTVGTTSITVLEGGVFVCIGSCVITNSSGGTNRYAAIAVNGTRIANWPLALTGASITTVFANEITYLNSGDAVSFQGYQDSGGSMTFGGSGGYLAVARVG